MLLLLGNPFSHEFGLAGVIVPKRPPCFAIPYFEPHWFLHDRPHPLPRTVLIQDVCNSEVNTFARFRLEESAKTISAKSIKSLSVSSGEYDISSPDWEELDTPVFLSSLERLYAFAESSKTVRVGHMEPLRRRLATSPFAQDCDQRLEPNKNFESGENQFTLLEFARFQRNRQMCLTVLRSCFDSLQQHSRALAVDWLEMTKADLKSEGILESTD